MKLEYYSDGKSYVILGNNSEVFYDMIKIFDYTESGTLRTASTVYDEGGMDVQFESENLKLEEVNYIAYSPVLGYIVITNNEKLLKDMKYSNIRTLKNTKQFFIEPKKGCSCICLRIRENSV